MRISKGRVGQNLTVIDPATRRENGLPILDVAAEMGYYGIPDPYNKGSKYYIGHYVCLWKVTAQEIIARYEWNEPAKQRNCYEEIVMPAFRKFRERRRPGSTPSHASAFDLTAMKQSLPSKYSAPTLCTQLIIQVVDTSISPVIERFEDSDSSFEDNHLANEDGPDSDDDVEEANQNDEEESFKTAL
jgi:hypothetical protein